MFVFVVFTLVPLLFIAAISWFYLLRFIRFLESRETVMRRAVYASAALLVVATAGGFAAPKVLLALTNKEPKRMNILILASDSLRSDHLSFNGYDRATSPNIDALAERSITFRQCMTPIGSTLESMTGLMSSQYPHTHGLRNMFPTAGGGWGGEPPFASPGQYPRTEWL